MNDEFSLEILTQKLKKKIGKNISNIDYKITQLHGGTLGDVKLVAGIANTAGAGNTQESFSLVLKKQKKWERPGDPMSWRREYDIYTSVLSKAFSERFCMPECYHAEISDEEIQLWMEYIDGVSGTDLTIEMLEKAAEELGCFQGRICRQQDDFKGISCLGDEGFLEREFKQWHTQYFTYDYLISERCHISITLKQMLKEGDIVLRDGKSFEYSYLRSKGCDIPSHLKQMIMDIDDNKENLFDELKKLPVVLCHRDFWHENIFHSGSEIRLIDWDTTGWGFLGEDIASLIVDGMDAERFEENCRRLIPAYLKGVLNYMNISLMDENSEPINKSIQKCILTITLIKFGYRMVQKYIFSKNIGEKNRGVNSLQKLYEMF